MNFSKADQLPDLLEIEKDISSAPVFAYENYVVKERQQGWPSDFTKKVQSWFEIS